MRTQIVIYECVGMVSKVPETCQFIAGLRIGYDPQPRWFCSGSTPDEAHARMEEFWAKEVKSHERPKPAPKPPEPSPAAPQSLAADDDWEVL